MEMWQQQLWFYVPQTKIQAFLRASATKAILLWNKLIVKWARVRLNRGGPKSITKREGSWIFAILCAHFVCISQVVGPGVIQPARQLNLIGNEKQIAKCIFFFLFLILFFFSENCFDFWSVVCGAVGKLVRFCQKGLIDMQKWQSKTEREREQENDSRYSMQFLQ